MQGFLSEERRGAVLRNLRTDAGTMTRDYLSALRTHMKKAVENGDDIGAAIRSFDAKPWAGLLNAADLHPGNASRTYLELERE